jgi:hypothetical protein
MIESMDLLR